MWCCSWNGGQHQSGVVHRRALQVALSCLIPPRHATGQIHSFKCTVFLFGIQCLASQEAAESSRVWWCCMRMVTPLWSPSELKKQRPTVQCCPGKGGQKRSRAVHRCTTGGAVLSHSSETCSAYSASCHLDGLTKLSPKPMCVFLLVCSRPVFEVLATCCTCCAVLHSKARTK